MRYLYLNVPNVSYSTSTLQKRRKKMTGLVLFPPSLLSCVSSRMRQAYQTATWNLNLSLTRSVLTRQLFLNHSLFLIFISTSNPFLLLRSIVVIEVQILSHTTQISENLFSPSFPTSVTNCPQSRHPCYILKSLFLCCQDMGILSGDVWGKWRCTQLSRQCDMNQLVLV